jgi:hypothetical protein
VATAKSSLVIVCSPAVAVGDDKIMGTFHAGTVKEAIGKTSSAPSARVQTMCRVAAEARRKARADATASRRKIVPFNVASKRRTRLCAEKPRTD